MALSSEWRTAFQSYISQPTWVVPGYGGIKFKKLGALLQLVSASPRQKEAIRRVEENGV